MKQRFETLLRQVDDILADHPDEVRPAPYDLHRHPHRRALRPERARRAGSVPSRPAHCISPVRAAREAHDRSPAAR